jgi:phosphatidylglycerophosphatase A
MDSKFANITATFLGCGLSKYAPGTMGSLGTIPLAYFLVYYGGFYALLLASVILFFVGAKLQILL